MKNYVSIIIPVYNTEKYLTKCLDSIINQTLKEIEIIIVNDGSSDNSQKIIDDYSAKDSRVKSIIKTNGGLSDARNHGIDHVTGEYIAFIDSDDYIESNMMEELYKKAVQYNAEIALCDLVKVDEQGNEFRDLPQSPQLGEKIILKDDFTLFGEMSCFACNKLFKKSLFEKHRFRKGIHFEDIELIPKLILDAHIVAKINKPFYKYFERQDSITKTHTRKGLDMFIAIDEVTKYFLKSNYSDKLEELKRFQIIQGYYSYLAYVAFVKDKLLKKDMLVTLEKFLTYNNITKKELNNYQRFEKNYLNSLPLKKRMFYTLAQINLSLLHKI